MTIGLRGLRGFGRHGVYASERASGQLFVVDLDLEVHAPRAAESDELVDTVDYGEIAERVMAVVQGEPVALLERLADRIATVCLSDERVDSAAVTVHKPDAPLNVPCQDVSLTISRSRA